MWLQFQASQKPQLEHIGYGDLDPAPSFFRGRAGEGASARRSYSIRGDFQVFILYLVEIKQTNYKFLFLYLFLLNSVCYGVDLWLLRMIPPLTPPLKPRGEDRSECAAILVIAACLSVGSNFVFIFNKFSVL